MQVHRRSWVLLAIAAWVAQAAGQSAGQNLVEQRLPETNAAGQLPSEARQILKQRCSECHSSEGNAFKAVVVDDHARLVGNGGRPVAPQDNQSPLLRLVREGTMPPGDVKLTAAEIDILARWVEQGAKPWPDESVLPRREFFGEADIINAIEQDLLSTQQRQRRFIRHFSLAHLYNAGVGEAELDVHRRALTKLLNSLSWRKRIAIPHTFGPGRTLLRIDLRDYGWTDSTWHQLVSHYPYVFGRFDERRITDLSGSPVAYLRADWFVATASQPPLYYQVLGLPSTVGRLETLLGVDTARHLAEERAVIRAGVANSGVSRNNRVLERHESPHGAYWKSFDFRSNAGRQNIFRHPLDFQAAGGEMIFHLPNGMQGYYLADADGRRIDKGPSDIVFDRSNPTSPEIVTGRSCMSCHVSGMKRFRDDMLPVLAQRPLSEERETALLLYAGQADLDRFLDEDGGRFGRAMFEATGERPDDTTREPIGRVSTAYEAPIDFARAAAELGDQPVWLRSRLDFTRDRGTLPGLDALTIEGGTVSRESWESTFTSAVRTFELGGGDFHREGAVRSQKVARTGLRSSFVDRVPKSVELLRGARSLYIHSGSTRLRVEAVQQGFRANQAFDNTEIAFVDQPRRADLRLRVGRPVFTFDFTYKLTDRRTGIVLDSGRFTAADAQLGIQEIVTRVVNKLTSGRQVQL